MRIGLLVCGMIGFAFADALGHRHSVKIQLVAIADQSKTILDQQVLAIHSCSFTTNPSDPMNAGLDWVFEAAG